MITFPDKESLSKCYCHHMKDKYLAEKTSKTVTDWLAGRNVGGKLAIANVASYAVYDYQEYLAQSGSEALIITAQMCETMYLKEINEAIAKCTVESEFYKQTKSRL